VAARGDVLPDSVDERSEAGSAQVRRILNVVRREPVCPGRWLLRSACGFAVEHGERAVGSTWGSCSKCERDWPPQTFSEDVSKKAVTELIA
jgi:hypothetical protein